MTLEEYIYEIKILDKLYQQYSYEILSGFLLFSTTFDEYLKMIGYTPVTQLVE